MLVTHRMDLNTDAPQPTVLVVDDTPANRHVLQAALEPEGYEILVAPDGETALKLIGQTPPDVVLLDVLMPGIDGFETCRRIRRDPRTATVPVIFITALAGLDSVIQGFHAGGVDYLIKPFRTEEVLARVRTHVQNSRLTRLVVKQNQELSDANQRLRREIASREQAEASLRNAGDQLSLLSEIEAARWGIDAMAGQSPHLRRVLDQVRKLQPVPATTILITGESGTGKELVARAIHFGGVRAQAPFLPINCTAIPSDLADSLLFGHTKGAFSGATADRKGWFEAAHGGTLFLDEIGDMPPPLQAKLLRALEHGTILPVGANTERRVDVRIIAATNADLPDRIQAGSFRADLYHRLARFVIDIPPLRDRREDIPLLARHFIDRLALEMGQTPPRLAPEALAALAGYDYPGNIRELKNLLERALIESAGDDILPAHLQFLSGFAGGPPETRPAPRAAPNPSNPKGDEDRILLHVRETGVITNADCRRLLGISMHQAWYLLRKLHLAGHLRQIKSGRWAEYRLP